MLNGGLAATATSAAAWDRVSSHAFGPHYLAIDLFKARCKDDFPSGWFRDFSEKSSTIAVVENVIQDTLGGIMDEDMDELDDGIRNSSDPVREVRGSSQEEPVLPT